MSHSAGFGGYRAALTTPGARGPVIAALLGRLPIAMVGFSLLLYVQQVTASYATAGGISATVLVGVAFGSVVQGRIMDRIGPTRPLLAATTIFAVFVVAEVTAVERGLPTAVLVVLAFVIGTSQPTIGTTSRAMWARLLPPGTVRNAAFTYEAVMTEVYFIVGPALSGALLAAPWPGTGVIVGATFMIVGSVWYALTATMRGFRPEQSAARGKLVLGGLASPGLRTVALGSFGMGIILGFVEVAVPAAARAAGNAAVGGALLGLWAVSSALFGLVYGLRPWPRSLRLRVPALLGGFAVLAMTLTLPGSLLGLAVMLLLSGALIAPQTAAHAEAVEHVAVRDLVTESFGWVVTASTLGIALGHAASGQIVEHRGLHMAYLVAGVVGIALAGVVHLRRNTITQLSATEPQTVA